jgi:hypothetical protein
MKYIYLFILPVLALFLISCQTTPTGPTQRAGSKGYVSRGDKLKHKGEMKLPENYSQETSFRKLTMLANFDDVRIKTVEETSGRNAVRINDLQREAAKIHLETMMGQIKRFDIKLLQSGAQGRALKEELQDIGFLKFKEKQSYAIDLILNANLVLAGETRNHADGSTKRIYSVTIDFSLMDDSDSVTGRSISVTGVTERTFFRDIVTGEYLAGFSLKDEEKAIKDAMFDAMKKAMVQFAIQFPVSGEIISIPQLDPERMGFDKGTFNGLKDGTELVVWYSDGGAGIPIAYATAEVGEKESTAVIYKWNNKNDRYKTFVQSIVQPGWLTQGNKLFVTSDGLAYPEEWEDF